MKNVNSDRRYKLERNKSDRSLVNDSNFLAKQNF